MPDRINLKLETAGKIIAFILESAGKENLEIAVAVSDRTGELISFSRTDDCCLASITVAISKSFSAARLGESTRNFLKNGYSLANLVDNRYTAYPGGLPFLVDGKSIGAVGISGLSPEEDEIWAEKAVNFFLEMGKNSI